MPVSVLSNDPKIPLAAVLKHCKMGLAVPDVWASEVHLEAGAGNTTSMFKAGKKVATLKMQFKGIQLLAAGLMNPLSGEVAAQILETELVPLVKDWIKHQQPKAQTDDFKAAMDTAFEGLKPVIEASHDEVVIAMDPMAVSVDQVKAEKAAILKAQKETKKAIAKAKPKCMQFIKASQFVNAVKHLRASVPGMGLTEAKEQCDIWKAESVSDVVNTGVVFEEVPVAGKEFKTVMGVKAAMSISAPKVALKAATLLGQATEGTDSDSTYFVVALGERANVSARIRSDYTVSVRVEPTPAFYTFADDLKQELVHAGWKMSEKHASLHLSCKDKITARKAVGAMVMSIGEVFNQVAIQVDLLMGASA